MHGFIDTLRRLGPARLTILGSVGVALAVVFLIMSSRLSAPNMALLFSDLSAQDSGQIVAKLEAQAVPFELRTGGSQIYVPAERALRLRMGFAEQGVPRGGSVGYELFDRTDAIGASHFLQGLNHVRALEGELARTIASLGPVAAARVHLVLPRRELFSRERTEPTASVVLKLREAGRLGRPQVQAIQHLVAAALPGMKPGRVSVVDDRGTLLARALAEGDDSGAAAGSSDELRRAYEQRLARTIEELLERTAGSGKVRSEVNVDMDFDRIVMTSETFDPDGQVVRSTQNVTESSDASDSSGAAPVSVAANLPDSNAPSAESGAPKSANRSARTEETVNYEISRTTRNHVRDAGIVRRLSVAVLIDGTWIPGADGNRAYKARTPDEMERFVALVRSTIGFKPERGDTLEVANLPFAVVETPEPAAADPSPFGLDKQDYFRFAEILVFAVVALLVILLVARPVIAHVFAAAASGPTRERTAMLADHSHGPPAALAPPQAANSPPPPSPDHMIDLSRVEGRVKASSVKKITEIVDKHPDEAMAIIRSWMYQER
ncbi:MAG: flagellar basal-body MS-ring/collar protein FliF [Pseudomonadota bacterium]